MTREDAEGAEGEAHRETIEREAEALTAALPDEERAAVRASIFEAARYGAGGDLGTAAQRLDQVRRALVAREHFRRFDNDIWAFVTLVHAIHRLSPEADPPPTYRVLLEMAPRTMESLTPAQRTFWYGASNAEVEVPLHVVPVSPPADPQPPADSGLGAVLAVGGLAVVLYVLHDMWDAGRLGRLVAGSLAAGLGVALIVGAVNLIGVLIERLRGKE
ncbi:MAG: hypothetical protein M9894_13140 [Planctomycetes bacterium]|nr:hypothetical protein [Planctomycetota bacterium]